MPRPPMLGDKTDFYFAGVPYKASLGPSQSETPCKSDETFDENLAGANLTQWTTPAIFEEK